MLRSGDHGRIARWRRAQALHRTLARPSRPGRRPGWPHRGGPRAVGRVPLAGLSLCRPPSRPDGPPGRSEQHAMKPTDLIDSRQPPRPTSPTSRPATGEGARKVVEGNKERVQVFQGNVIRRQGRGVARDVHGPQGQLRRRRRAHLPAAHADHRQARGRPHGRRPPGQAVLPAATAPARRPRSRRSAQTLERFAP